MIQLGNHWVPEDWPVRGEAASTFRENLLGEFFHKYMAGDVIIDVGFRGQYENTVPILPHAIGVDVDYPGYDGVTLPFADGSVDTVYSSHMLEHAPDYKATIRDWYRTLKPGGFIVCVVPHQFLYEKKIYLPSIWNSDHKRFYTPASLLREFEESLEPNSYRIRLLRDNDQNYRYSRGPDEHAAGCYQIELVIQKIQKPEWGLLGSKSEEQNFRSVTIDAESIVTAMYRVLLLREPEKQGLRSHSIRLREGADPASLLRACVTCPEFSANFPRFYRKYIDTDHTRLVTDSSQHREVDLLRSEVSEQGIPDKDFYQPLFSPWVGFGEFSAFHRRAASNTLVSADRCYILYSLARQALGLRGDFWECGVYKGGTAAMLAEIIARTPSGPRHRLHLFDTFTGMPDTDPNKDMHHCGDFGDTSLEEVRAVVGHEEVVSYHQGFIPDTFNGFELSQISLAHVDVDIYQSVLDCCCFIFPRLTPGGFMVFDDYGFPSCPGARAAVDEYFRETGAYPLVLPTGQAVIFKSE
jgi:O-methyltransferase